MVKRMDALAAQNFRPLTLEFTVMGEIIETRSILETGIRQRMAGTAPAGVAKNVEFFVVCLSVRHAFERRSLCARFRHEGVRVQKPF